MARQRIHNHRAGRGSGSSGASWISYSDLMCALVLMFVLMLSVILHQYFKMIETKTAEHVRILSRADRWDPTSQVCSVCGVLDGKKPLSIREWECGACGTALDRDYNASVNIIVAAGLAETLNARGENVRRVLAMAGSRSSR